jgi:hypothetical protein
MTLLESLGEQPLNELVTKSMPSLGIEQPLENVAVDALYPKDPRSYQKEVRLSTEISQ